MADVDEEMKQRGKKRREIVDIKSDYQDMRAMLLQKYSHFVVQQRTKSKGSHNMTANDMIVSWSSFGPYFVVMTTSREEGNKLWVSIFQKAQEKKIVHSIDKSSGNPIYVVNFHFLCVSVDVKNCKSSVLIFRRIRVTRVGRFI